MLSPKATRRLKKLRPCCPVRTALILVTLVCRLSFVHCYDATLDDPYFRLEPLLVDVTSLCKTYQSLNRKQVALCRRFPDVTWAALQGLQVAVSECQHQMRRHRWNCSSLATTIPARNPQESAIVNRGFRESAFAAGVTSAGVVHSVARACSRGSALSCTCDAPHPPPDVDYAETVNVDGEMGGREGAGVAWHWRGCSDNVAFGDHFARHFLLSKRRPSQDLHSRVLRHNNNAGRQAVLSNMAIKCKCHGMSGSCEVRTCWRSAPHFRSIGDALKERYKHAALVDDANSNGRGRRGGSGNNNGKRRVLRLVHSPPGGNPKRRRSARPRRTDLVFYEKSPTFCDADQAADSGGTRGRHCNRTSTDIDNCGPLCCGRGYNTLLRRKQEKCRCRFHWCCHVECEECVHEHWVTVCK